MIIAAILIAIWFAVLLSHSASRVAKFKLMSVDEQIREMEKMAEEMPRDSRFWFQLQQLRERAK